MGLTVWVLERSEWLLRRQLDESGGRVLKEYLEALGLVIETNAETACVGGETQVTHVVLKDGRTLPCDMFLVAVGIQPNTELARAAGLRVNRGVIVDETMRTNAPDIFAAGDVCEFANEVPGLWAVAVEQAKVAALNAVGVHAIYDEVVPVTMLKVAGVDVTSMGRIETRSDAEIEIAQANVEANGYRKLIIANGQLVGATLVGDPSNAQIVAAAVKERREVSHLLDALHAGHWGVLSDPAAQLDNHAVAKWTTVAAPQPKPIVQSLPIAEPVIKMMREIKWPAAQSAMIERASAPQEELIAEFE
jgi:NAD(P)H-nitrite reductase large subunit